MCTADVKRCYRCGQKGHTTNDCKFDDVVCFNCNEQGHIGSQCKQPKKTKTTGRVFALTGTQTENNDRLIRGTCYIADQSLVTIIDTGATHCFIALDCCYTLILDLKILIQVSLLFSDTFKLTVFSTVLQLHTLLFLSDNFLHKIIQKGILVISYKGTHFSPYNLSLSLFNLFA